MTGGFFFLYGLETYGTGSECMFALEGLVCFQINKCMDRSKLHVWVSEVWNEEFVEASRGKLEESVDNVCL